MKHLILFENFNNEFDIVSFTNDKKFINNVDILDINEANKYLYKKENIYNIIKHVKSIIYFTCVALKNTNNIVGYFWKYKTSNVEYYKKYEGRYETDENYRNKGVSKLFIKNMLKFIPNLYFTVFFTNLKSLKSQISMGAKIIDCEIYDKNDFFYFIINNDKIKFNNYLKITDIIKNNKIQDLKIEVNGVVFDEIYQNWNNNNINININGKYILLLN